MENTELNRQTLLSLIGSTKTATCVRPILGVKFEDTGEVYYMSKPTLAQLKIPAIIFLYDSKEHWLQSHELGEVLYNKKGDIVITAE